MVSGFITTALWARTPPTASLGWSRRKRIVGIEEKKRKRGRETKNSRNKQSSYELFEID